MKLKLFFLLLLCNSAIFFANNIDTLWVNSKSMNKKIANIVIVPENYSSQKKELPVLYLLHGAGDNYTSWLTKVPKIKDYATTYNMIIVCPDGGKTSWYFNSPVDETMNYETYISNELVNAIDAKYNTLKNRKGRAISGASMGGHGAFYLAFRHQDIWGAAGSISGGLDIRPFKKNWDLPKRLGTYAEHPENWENNTIMNMVDLVKNNNLKLIFDCGTNDFFYKVNLNLHKKLLENNVDHDYIERPGKHTWNYRVNSIKYQIVFFNDFFKV